jgi:RNA polymerase sigma factor (sigma-70 family)
MPDTAPPELSQLLAASPAQRERAWESFVACYHRLLLHVARKFGRDHDTAMDAFAWMLDRLREDDFRRLRGFSADGRSEFTTWLVVVARRLCLDWYRAKYGRDRSKVALSAPDERSTRRRLVDLVGEAIDAVEIPEGPDTLPDIVLQEAELAQALQHAVTELEPGDRLLIKLRFDDGLSAADIADILRLPTPFHVYRRITHVLDGLRRALRARGIEGRVP